MLKGHEKTSCQVILGEAADVAALFLTWEKEFGDPRLTEFRDLFWDLTEMCSITGIFHSHFFVHLAQTLVSTHSTVPPAAVSSKLLNILVLVGPG